MSAASQEPSSPIQGLNAQSQAGQAPPSSNGGSKLNAPGKPGATAGERLKSVGGFLKNKGRGYMASFLLVGVMIPVVSSIILVALYFSYGSSRPVLLEAHLWTLLLWLVAAVICYRFTTADSAKVDSYGLLVAHLCQLRAKLGLTEDDDELEKLEERCGDIQVAMGKIRNISPQMMEGESAAVTTALTSYIDIRKLLVLRPTGSLWAFGTGYCNAWRLLHQAEEALIAFDSKPEILYGAMNDEMALQGSTITAKNKLIKTLYQAVNALGPKSERYFEEYQSNKKHTTSTDSSTDSSKEENTQNQLNNTTQNEKDNDRTHHYDEYEARCALRRVRSALNGFRDRRWEGLLRARNRLLAAIAITGIVTHILLGLAIVIGVSKSYLIAVTAFYLVGAVAGLFGRFYREWQAGSTVDDFGYSIARLVAIPLLSGLAGAGGVLLTVMVAPLGELVLSSPPTSLDLARIFQVVPQFLLLAAIFGLTPNLLLTGLQKTAKKYESDIISSKVAQQHAVSDSEAYST